MMVLAVHAESGLILRLPLSFTSLHQAVPCRAGTPSCRISWCQSGEVGIERCGFFFFTAVCLGDFNRKIKLLIMFAHTHT